MAIYHFHAKVMQRSQGQSAVAAAAYRSASVLLDERADKVHDYHNRGGVVQSHILAPSNAPDWMKERQTLWNGVEAKEKRKDAQLAREVEVSLPRELDMETNAALIQEFIQEKFVKQGMVADLSIHNGLAGDGQPQPHAHIMLTMRDIKGDSFGEKNRDWNQKPLLNKWRQSWADLANRYLERAGSDERIDHRTLVDQGIDRLPTVHVGKDATAMEEKGIPTERGDRNREIKLITAAYVLIKDAEIEPEPQPDEWYTPDLSEQQWAKDGMAYFAEDREFPEVIHAEDDGIEQASQFDGWYIPEPSVQQWAKDWIGQIAEDRERQEHTRAEDAEIELEPHIHAHVEADRGIELGR